MNEPLHLNFPAFAADSWLAGLLGSPLAPILFIIPIFYFLVFLPQQRQRRKTQDMLAGLKTGDRVVTSGGIYGTVVGFRDLNVIQLQVASQVKIDIAKSAITGLDLPESPAESTSPQEEGGGKKKS